MNLMTPLRPRRIHSYHDHHVTWQEPHFRNCGDRFAARNGQCELVVAGTPGTFEAMCNRYRPPRAEILESQWQLKPGRLWTRGDVFPRGQGPFLRAARDSTEYQRELVVGQWALIPWFAKTPKLTYSTNNARSEELEAKAAYKYPWQRGQRCIIPAEIFWEPNWESNCV